MSRFLIFLAFLASLAPASLLAQNPSTSPVKLYFAPSFSPVFLSDHTGLAVGFQGGVSLWQERLNLGILAFSRSGPLNGQGFAVALPEGTTYKGQSELELRADHGYFGLMVAPGFFLGPQKRLKVELPLSYGIMGAGFYLQGADRETPDDRRVSEWENDLFNDQDAAIVTGMDVGVQTWWAVGKATGTRVGLGLHYSQAFGWEVAVKPSDYYNRLRASFSIRFGS